MPARGGALAALAAGCALAAGVRSARATCIVEGQPICGQGNGNFAGTLPNGNEAQTCFCDANCFSEDGALNDCCPDVCEVCPELEPCKALAEADESGGDESGGDESGGDESGGDESGGDAGEPSAPAPTKPEIPPETGKNRTVVQDPRFAAGVVTTVAGSGEPAIGLIKEDDGIGNGTAFLSLRGMAGSAPEDCASDLVFLVDQKLSKVRQVNTKTTFVSTLGGLDDQAGSKDGCNGNSTFNSPHAVADAGDFLFIADTANNCLRRVHKEWECSITLVGPCVPAEAKAVGGSGKAPFGKPRGVAAHQNEDGSIDVYLADEGFKRIVKVNGETGEWTTISENPKEEVDLINPNIWKLPRGLAITPDGTKLVVADDGFKQIFTIDLTKEDYPRTLLAGDPWNENGSVSVTYIDGPAMQARFFRPRGVCTTNTFAVVADYMNNAYRSVDLATGEVKTIFGGASGSDGANDPSLEGFPPDYNTVAADGPVAEATADNPTACAIITKNDCAAAGVNDTLTSDIVLYVGDDFSHRLRMVEGTAA